MSTRTLVHAAIIGITVFLTLVVLQAEDEKAGTIEGFAVSPQMDYARFVNFRVEVANGKWRKVVATNLDGKFEFRGLKPGVYTLQPEKTKPMCAVPLHKVKIQIFKDETVHADLELKRPDDYERNCIMDREHP